MVLAFEGVMRPTHRPEQSCDASGCMLSNLGVSDILLIALMQTLFACSR